MNDLMKQNNMPANAPKTALATAEQSRAIAEVQAALVVARANPRDELLAEKKITNACKRKKLAEDAIYRYKRGGQAIQGPSIRLAEVLARCWQNCHYGFREVSRDGDVSEVQAYCYDLENNVKVTREFQVPLFRDTKKGRKPLTSDRDRYEVVANMAQRRVRACILEIIPGDIVDAAVEACEATLRQSVGDIEKAKAVMLEKFAKFGVTKEMIEAYLQRSIDSIVPADVVNLRKIYNSIRDGIGTVKDWFPPEAMKKAEAEVIDTEGEVGGEPVSAPEEPEQSKTAKKESEKKQEKPATTKKAGAYTRSRRSTTKASAKKQEGKGQTQKQEMPPEPPPEEPPIEEPAPELELDF